MFLRWGVVSTSPNPQVGGNTFYSEELLAPLPIPKLEEHPSSAVRDCLFNIFAATHHIGGLFSVRNLRTRHAVEAGTHLSWVAAHSTETAQKYNYLWTLKNPTLFSLSFCLSFSMRSFLFNYRNYESAWGGVEILLYGFLMTTLEGGDWPALRPGPTYFQMYLFDGENI